MLGERRRLHNDVEIRGPHGFVAHADAQLAGHRPGDGGNVRGDGKRRHARAEGPGDGERGTVGLVSLQRNCNGFRRIIEGGANIHAQGERPPCIILADREGPGDPARSPEPDFARFGYHVFSLPALRC